MPTDSQTKKMFLVLNWVADHDYHKEIECRKSTAPDEALVKAETAPFHCEQKVEIVAEAGLLTAAENSVCSTNLLQVSLFGEL